MPVAELPFDLVEVKLAAPQTRPGTVAKADVIARLSSIEIGFLESSIYPPPANFTLDV